VHAVQGQLEEVTRMLETDAYCMDVMKQVQTVQSLLDSVHRATMHKHLETCFVEAVLYGREQTAIVELVGAVKFTPTLTAKLDIAAIALGAASDTRKLLGATTLSLPGISSQRCRTAVEGIVRDRRRRRGRGQRADKDGRYPSRPPRIRSAADRSHRGTGVPRTDDYRRKGRQSRSVLRSTGRRRPRTRAQAPEEYDAVQAALGFLDGDGI
jgi:CsoR family transcriptional regulator, copper-sensing transcriptional repressor